MKTIKILSFCLLAGLFSSCLDENPQAIAEKDQITDPESFVNPVYSILGNDHYDMPFSLWPYGNVRSDDAYKGGSGEADIQAFHFFEISSNITTDLSEPDKLWFQLYVGISRANEALRSLKNIDIKDFPKKEVRMGEVKFLRGHFYFMLKILFKNIPFIDETMSREDIESASNVALTNDELWEKIAQDFEYAYSVLPTSQPEGEAGRADKYAAAAYLAKVRLYKAYRQDDMNNVTGIDSKDLEEVLFYTQEVIDSQYELEKDYAYNFLPGDYENGIESIFAVQYSKDDGTKFGRLNFSDLLSVPNGLGCCDFHKPSQNLVNAFKTQNGLPMFNSYNTKDYNSESDKSDPRLFHTVAMDGFPYKYNPNRIYINEWNRNIDVYGTYASLKENVDPECDCFTPMIPFYANSKNRILLRYSDVLLMRAEALIELKRQHEALPIINQVRQRAQSSTKFIDYAPGIEIASYPNDATWTYEYAQQALRWERRLELAMEGSRFFDLVRWGIADKVINQFYTTEASKRALYKDAKFTKNKNEYVPIPEQQIRLSRGIYKQNYGWK